MPDSLVVTISDETNYGNRLQNYALVRMLSRYGECNTARHIVDIHSNKQLCKQSVKMRLHLTNIGLLINCLQHPCNAFYRLERARLAKMHKFTVMHTPDNCFRLTAYKQLEALKNDVFDTVVLGSDQIWNSQWLSSDDLKLRLGSFVEDNTRVISYAASFGISQIDDINAQKTFAEYLPKIDSISVREDRAMELVDNLAHVPAKVVLDPTLMLTPEQWEKITKSFVADDDRYVLTYFLGKPSMERRRCIDEYAQAHHCRVRKILDLDDPETYVAGPEDFVELFAKAQYVFTDSYHACCFSLLFHKQFTVFARSGLSEGENMNSRMETLFRLFRLASVVTDNGVAPDIDYCQVDELLERHRTESRVWLDAAMER